MTETMLARASRDLALSRYRQDIANARARYKAALSRIEASELSMSKKTSEIGEVKIVLSARTRNGLCNVGITLDPEAISKVHARQLLKIPNFGKKCLVELAAWLKQEGYSLRY